MEVKGMSPCDSQQDFKPNLRKYQEQVGWESVGHGITPKASFGA